MPPRSFLPDHVLIVDGDPVVLNLLRHTLRAGGFNVTAVASGSAALLTLCTQRERIGWLVTTIALPGLVDGWILADEYHQHQPRRPALFLAAADSQNSPASVDALVLPPTAPLQVLEALKVLRSMEPMAKVTPSLRRMA